MNRSCLKVFNVTRLKFGDVSVPEVINDLGEVDVFGERPGHVLPDARGRAKLAGHPFGSPLMKNLWVTVTILKSQFYQTIVSTTV